MKINHIGYLVKNLKKAEEKFKLLGFETVQEAMFDEIRGVDISFMQKDGYVIELVSPAKDDSVVSNLIKTYKNSPYHLCYESTNFAKDIEFLTSNGFMQIDNATPAPAFNNQRVSFLFSSQIGMIEILDKEQN